jgi:hypothetical protein
MRELSARPNITPSSVPILATARSFQAPASSIQLRDSTRDSQTSRNACKSLKTKDGDPVYPTQSLSPNRVFRSATALSSLQLPASSIQNLIGTRERLELDVTRCESTAVTLLIGTDRILELHRCYTPRKSRQRPRVRE